MKTTLYPVFVAWSEDDQAFIAETWSLPGCKADGATREEAVKNLELVIQDWIDTARELGRDVPEPMTMSEIERLAKVQAEKSRRQREQVINDAVQQAVQQMVPKIVSQLMRMQAQAVQEPSFFYGVQVPRKHERELVGR